MAKGPQYRDSADAINLMRVMAWFVPACFTMLGFLWYFMLNKGWIPVALFVMLVTDNNDPWSPGEDLYYYRALKQSKGAGNDSLVRLSAVAGPPPSG